MNSQVLTGVRPATQAAYGAIHNKMEGPITFRVGGRKITLPGGHKYGPLPIGLAETIRDGLKASFEGFVQVYFAKRDEYKMVTAENFNLDPRYASVDSAEDFLAPTIERIAAPTMQGMTDLQAQISDLRGQLAQAQSQLEAKARTRQGDAFVPEEDEVEEEAAEELAEVLNKE